MEPYKQVLAELKGAPKFPAAYKEVYDPLYKDLSEREWETGGGEFKNNVHVKDKSICLVEVDSVCHAIARFTTEPDLFKKFIGPVRYQISLKKVGLPFVYKGRTIHVVYIGDKLRNFQNFWNWKVSRIRATKETQTALDGREVPFSPEIKMLRNFWDHSFGADINRSVDEPYSSHAAYEISAEIFFILEHRIDYPEYLKPLKDNWINTIYDLFNLNTPLFKKRAEAAELPVWSDKEKAKAKERYLRSFDKDEEYRKSPRKRATEAASKLAHVPEEILVYLMTNPKIANDVIELVRAVSSVRVNSSLNAEEARAVIHESLMLTVIDS